MTDFIAIAIALSPLVLGYMLVRCRSSKKNLARDADILRTRVALLEGEAAEANQRWEAANRAVERLKPYEMVANADDEAKRIIDAALATASADAAGIRAEADSLRKAATQLSAKAKESAQALTQQVLAPIQI